MTKITFYGGINEIGGNKIYIEDGRTKIFLDFGMSFSYHFSYFDSFLNPRKLNGLGDFYELGLLPKIEGIYRDDYLSHMGAKSEKLDCDGVFISHAHADHVSNVHFLKSTLPIYASKETLKIMESIEETSGSSGFCELVNLKETFKFRKKKTGEGYTRFEGNEAKIPRELRNANNPAIFDDITVTASKVNHSLPGALAYVINAKNCNIAYSGDLRFHGYGGHLTEKFIENAKDVDILIIEGTRINSNTLFTEKQLKDKVSKEISETKGIVLANWPLRDIDRLLSFFEAAKENGRILVLSTKQANLLEKLSEVNEEVPKITDKNIRIFLTRKSWGLLDREDLPDPKLKLRDYEEWERRYLEHPNMIDYTELQANPSEYVVRVDFFDMTELIDIQPNEKSHYIRSTCEPFDDKMEFNERIINSWLTHFKIRKTPTIHCSGHAPGQDIKRIIEEINPKSIVPVHTLESSKFKELGRNCIIPTIGKQIDVS